MKHCVITGAADGIGKALAWRFAQADYRITGIDVDPDRIRQTESEFKAAGRDITFILTDLIDQAELNALSHSLTSGPAIDVMVHNAGINAVGHFARQDLAQQRRVLQLNLLAPMLLTAPLLQHQKLNAGGSLIFIASLSRFVSYPGAAVYAAGKDGLASYARSLSVALAGQDIHVLTVYPGPTRTEHARRYSPDNRREASRMLPEVLAAQIFQAMQSRRRVLIPGLGNKLFAVAGKYLPRLTEWAMKKALLDKLE